MTGLLVRLVLLAAVLFGVAYGITRALRANAHGKEAKRIQAEIRALRAGIEAGLFTQEEYRQLITKIRVDCEREGIEVPDLPERLDTGQTKEGSS
ncbi:MAG: hypothetical protein OEZ06_15630 [Myxococcales bacterium]|nr:hypothetical protein [Myxococcales bacterium]